MQMTGSCPMVNYGISSAQLSGSASSFIVLFPALHKEKGTFSFFNLHVCIITAFDSEMYFNGLRVMAIELLWRSGFYW